MSTSRIDAEYDLSTQLPSCSYSFNDDASNQSPLLCPDLLIEIFKQTVRISTVKQAMKLKKVCPLAHYVVAQEMAKNDTIRVEILKPEEYKIVGLKREKLEKPATNIIVQGSPVNNIEDAVALVRILLDSMKTVRTVQVYSADPDNTHMEMILSEIAGRENLCLTNLLLRRKRGGQVMQKIIELVKAHSTTLRRLGQIGLGEAAECFSDKISLDRLCLNTFDLGFDADPVKSCDYMLKICQSGAKTKHLSYSSFEGFDPTEAVVQRFLTELDVNSLRLTMMRGPYVMPQPDYMIGKVRKIEKLEVVEVVEKTSIFNSLITYEKTFKKVFPNVEFINYSQDWSK